ncbi:MAG TPA: 3-hydroxyacyl-CoA dehydrogenase NAD-binding domain-containing protein [Actinomycetota bacterium]|nr:3-hydroxyacyl-CoA dehydrogenase NAD-binding domain-containing protein [Actinomycetota bacterium]
MVENTVAVVGVGTVGTQVAKFAAGAGWRVVAIEKDEASAQAASQRAGMPVGASLSEAATADIVIECLPERQEVKHAVFAELGGLAADSAVLVTTATALSVTDLALSSGRPNRVLGLSLPHEPARAHAELVRPDFADSDAVESLQQFLAAIGREFTVVRSRPGYIADGLLFGYLNHAVTMYEAGYASRDDIDAAMRFGCGYPIGPLRLLDKIGIDTAYDVLDALYATTGRRLHAPAPILKQMIAAGLTGEKSGKGFYDHTGQEQKSGAAAETADVRPVATVGVVGTGTMASGIVEVFAKSGYEVVFVARSDEKVAGVQAAVTKSLDKAVAKGRMTEEARAEVLSRITGATQREALADVDLVVEAIVEDLDVKLELFRDLDRICKPGAILATTTSSLPVVEMAAVTSRPQDVVGMHFFNPAPIMKLVEVVSPVTTGPDVTATVADLCAKVGKHAVKCGDRAGFIVNALLFPYLNDAVLLLESHYATADEIDTVMTKSAGLPLGPFALLDVVGNDVSLAIEQTLHAEFRLPELAPARLLEQVVEAGYLGRKTRRGFRTY